MQGDRWICRTCGKGFYEPDGFERYSDNDKINFELSCPHCQGYKTLSIELKIQKTENHYNNVKDSVAKWEWKKRLDKLLLPFQQLSK